MSATGEGAGLPVKLSKVTCTALQCKSKNRIHITVFVAQLQITCYVIMCINLQCINLHNFFVTWYIVDIIVVSVKTSKRHQ